MTDARTKAIAAYKARGGKITVCGKDHRYSTHKRTVRASDTSEPSPKRPIPVRDHSKLLPDTGKLDPRLKALTL